MRLLVVAFLVFTAAAFKSHNKCPNNTNRLMALFNFICNATQTVVTSRDACYGCFFRAAQQPAVNGALATFLAQCAALYLVNSTYAACVNTFQPTAVCTAHCAFVQCIRRRNSQLLMDECMTQALAVNPAFAATSAGRIALLGNATGCILARARCSPYNPITGDLRTGAPLSTALQIAGNGDLRIVAFAPNVATGELFCSSRTPLDQAAYLGALC
ncbi:uncharacterized protein LOC132260989 [Phlebotomus argentipes]|uniref:uncharacterized protein LOC132260989 n=1 Tax=Phlebotomus argentipes TaxID=94469 RepID=UPI00289373EC|nr:uncharacterized protein LOC132260989 [Phlebotomus argentipes]